MDIKNTNLNANLTTGIVAIGKFNNLENLAKEIESKLFETTGNNYKKVEASDNLLKEIGKPSSQIKMNTFGLNLKPEERKYTFLFLEEKFLHSLPEEITMLINEKSPLKLIPIVQISTFKNLSQELIDSIFANFANFVVENIDKEDEDLLGSHLPNYKNS